MVSSTNHYLNQFNLVVLTGVFAFQTNGNSNGLVPMLRVYNHTARYVDQGGNRVHTDSLAIGPPSPNVMRLIPDVRRLPVGIL